MNPYQSKLEEMASQLRDAIREEAMLKQRSIEITQENSDITNRLIALDRKSVV